MGEQIRKAIVTGATGLLGNNLVRQLVAEGISVRALVRSPEKAKQQFEGLQVELAASDINHPETYAGALAGADVVFHTAAYFRDGFGGPQHAKHIYETNVTGTRNLLATAYAAGIRRFVHTSSIAALKGKPGQITDETMLRGPEDGNDYYRSKVQADREIETFLAAHPDAWACMVLPGFMVGPGDAGPTPSGRTVVDFVQKKFPGIPNAAFSVVDARDVADAMVRAATHGRRGERYLAAGTPMTIAEICAVLERVTGVPAPTRRVPDWMLFTVAAMQEGLARLTGKTALINRETVRLMKTERDYVLYDSSKTERELGVSFRPPEESWEAAYVWLREKGGLSAGNAAPAGGALKTV
jgi:nucleoside-diphosphate-sugar epimerase